MKPTGKPVTHGTEMTPRQKAILEFIRDHLITEQHTPTHQDIADAFGIESKNGVACHLKALVKRGLISRVPNSACGIRLLGVEVTLTPKGK